jgi:hypothetical protein
MTNTPPRCACRGSEDRYDIALIFQEVSDNNTGQQLSGGGKIFVIPTEARSTYFFSPPGRSAEEDLLIFTEGRKTFSFPSVFCRFDG